MFHPPPLANLGRLASYDRFFLYKLEGWNGKKFKTKTPTNGLYTIDPASACMSYADACALLATMDTPHALGWHIRADAGVWFLDVDELGEQAEAAWNFAANSGCMFEYSNSGNGVHVIGSGLLPPHGNRKANLAFELYSRDRGICFGITGQAWGNASALSFVPDRWMLPPVAGGSAADASEYDQPDAEWDGPEDDAELLQMMHKRRDAEKVFTGGCTLSELLNGDRAAIARAWPDAADKEGGLCSEADSSLASHLAFYTGKHLPRMMRLLKSSGLYREKFERDDYLHRTCLFACKRTSRVYARPKAPMVQLPPLPVIAADSGEWARGIDAGIARLRAVGNLEEMRQACVEVMQIQAWENIEIDALRAQLKKTAAAINLTPGARTIRDMLPYVVGTGTAENTGGIGKPEWLEEWVFEGSSGRYYNSRSMLFYSTQAAEKMMRGNPGIPLTPAGKQANPIEYFDAYDLWNGTRVDVMQYAPDRAPIFEEDGRAYFNTYNPATVPQSYQPIPEDVAAVIRHIDNMCSHREDVKKELITWMAWQVQRPGQMLRWAPLAIGNEGCGKSYIGTLMRHVIGLRNSTFAQDTDINNSGGFTDWAYGKALTMIEEIHVQGRDKYAVYNRVKPYITNEIVTINRKGGSMLMVRNTTNYYASSNFDAAVPVGEDDRRWLIIKCPDLKTDLGAEYGAYFSQLYDIAKLRPGSIRGWLESISIPDTWPQLPLKTTDKQAMIEDGESTAQELVKKYTLDGVFNLTDSFLRCARDAEAMGDKVTHRSLGMAARQSYGMHLFTRKLKSGDKTKLYVLPQIAKFMIKTPDDALNRWKDAGGGKVIGLLG